MYCKYCAAELPENETKCPACGRDTAEPEQKKGKKKSLDPVTGEKKKPSPKKIAIAIGAGVLAIALVAVIMIGAMGGFKPRENTYQYKDNYTVSDKKAAEKADEVIATIGDKKLTNGQLQVFYWMQVYDFLDYYGSYASMYGLDYTKPLNEQYYSEKDGVTWQQYFLKTAIEGWQNYAVLCLMGEEAGYELDEEYVKFFEELPDTLLETAKENKYESVDAMFKADMGAGCNMESYIEYMNLYYYGYLYFGHLYDNMSPSMSQIETYFEENKETMEKQGYGKDDGNNVAVRHILVKIQGGVKGEDNKVVYTDAEWAECKKKAQAILDEWKAGEATEDTFADLAKEKSEDTGSKENGGLYENITSKTNFVEPFLKWCMDANRKTGDTDLVKTDYGYHIMYFTDSEPLWIVQCRNALISERLQELLKEETAKRPMEVDYKAVVLGDVELVTAK